MPRLQILAILFSVALLWITFELVRRKRLREEYSLLWFATAFGFLGLSLAGQRLGVLTELLGFRLVSNTILVFGILFLLGVVFALTIAVSTLTSKMNRLSQEVSLLRDKMGRGKDPGP